MGILNIRPATREGAHLLIQCFGGPRSGKTYTALRLARGIAGPAGKIGVLDTEAGRARLYSDKIAGGFFVGDLTPPFTPKRYRDAIEEFVSFGADVLVIDSFSHVWQGPGGVLELADQAEANGKKGLQKWLAPKVEYRKLITFLLSTNIHIIFCSRGKQPVVEQTVNGRKELVTLPWEPVQDKLLKYEMTVVLPMTLDGGYETDPTRMKAPDDIAHLFTGDLLTEAAGAAIAQWVAGGAPIDHARELLSKRANDAATDGSEVFRAFWKNLNASQRDALRGGLGNLQSISEEADAEQERKREIERENAERAGPNLDAPFGSKKIEHIVGVPQEDEFGLKPLTKEAEDQMREWARAREEQSNSPPAQPVHERNTDRSGGPAPAGEPDQSASRPAVPPAAGHPGADAALPTTRPDMLVADASRRGGGRRMGERGEGSARPFATPDTAASGGDGGSGDSSRRDGGGPTATTDASHYDLHGEPENLTVPLPARPTEGQLDHFARQMLHMIGEQPRSAQRSALIRRANERGMELLKAYAVSVAQYDEIQAALAAKPAGAA